MAGISSKAAGGIQNRYKFNGGTELENKEFSDGSGLDLYATEFRRYDAQIGRFHQIDPLSEVTGDWSPYSFALDNPTLLNDPLGLLADSLRAPDGQMVVDNGSMENITITSKTKSTASSSTSTPNASYAFIGGSGGHALLEQALQQGAKEAAKDVVVKEGSKGLLRLGGTAALTITATVWPLAAGPDFPNGDEMYYKKLEAINPPRPAPLNPTPVYGVPDPNAELYTLRAAKDGWYPKFTWGQGQRYSVLLQRGMIWKIGTTINGQSRYAKNFYESTGAGLYYNPEFRGPLDQVLFAEKMRLINYALSHNGELPPGNTKLQ